MQLKFRYGSAHAQIDGTKLDLSQVSAIINSKSWIFVVTWTVSTGHKPGSLVGSGL